MLSVVKAYSSWRSAPTLLLNDPGRPETDLIQIRNIDGLDPVKASVNTSLYGSVDGAAYVGGSIASRNIILTVHPNPDWDIWSYEALRRLIYSYFMPKQPTRLVFESDDIPPVEISGIVESVEVNPFSKDQEFLISIVCPDPHFTALEPIVLTGQSNMSEPIIVDYNGNIETGINVKISHVSDPVPNTMEIRIGDPQVRDLAVGAGVSASMYFEMNSIAMRKYVQNINIGTGVITNLLSKVFVGSTWPLFQPGENEFFIITDQGVQDWELTYFERFGGL
jgi:Phage tail protein